MIKPLLCTSVLALLPLAAQVPSRANVWKAADLQFVEKKMTATSPAHQLGEWGNYRGALSHREKSGEPEVHDHVSDLFVIQSGGGTVVTGGKGVGLKETAKGEWRGGSIEGGDKRKVGPGDVVHIPARTPHQFLLDPGQKVTYLTFKVDQPASGAARGK